MAMPAVTLNQAAIAFPLLYYQFCKVKYISSVFFKNAFDKFWVFMEATPVLCLLCPILVFINNLSGGATPKAEDKNEKKAAKSAATANDDVEELDTDKMKKFK